MIHFLSDDKIKTAEMKRYEDETGKFAIWRGNITEGFKKWQAGGKIYSQDKERISVLVSEEIKEKWLKFQEENNFTAISKLIRTGVNFYIDSQAKISYIENFSDITHSLKIPLTSIKGFSQIIIEEYKEELSWDILSKIKSIYDQSLILEEIIADISNGATLKESNINAQYDILIVDDDNSTIELLTAFFDMKSFDYKIASSGREVLDMLDSQKPKIILLDIILPDIEGYEVCKRIKADKKFKHVKVFYITAVHKTEVESKMKETGADGYFLKPFDIIEFRKLSNFL